MTRRRWALLLGVLVSLVAVFVAGLYAGRWAVKTRMSPRVQQHLAAKDGWVPANTHLVRLEYMTVNLPNAGGWGGGVEALDDERLLYATGHGRFGLITRDGETHALPFAVDMAKDALGRHPVARAKNFNPNWFRVTDISLAKTAQADRFELLVGHHHFDAQRGCVELWLSRAELLARGTSVTLAAPFQKILSTRPCITFESTEVPGNSAFNGWASGGRILRLAGDKTLFSTGDHKWNGLRGYPAVSQSDESTLGKILLVDLKTGESRVLAKGLRNPQGLAMDSAGRIWETEHGPRGGDELNLIREGTDYGWPYATYGTDYGPLPWPHNAVQGRHDGGTPPMYSWTPSIGVSSLIAVRGKEFPLWKDDLLVLSLAHQSIHRLRMRDDRVVYDEPIEFFGYRLRDITEFPDGRLAILTDEGDVLLLRNGDQPDQAPYLDARRQLKRSDDMMPAQREKVVAGAYSNGVAIQPVVTASKSPAHPTPEGYEVFTARCGGCHSIAEGAATIAPSLSGVVGRKIGSTRYPYSNALAGIDATWSSDEAIVFATAPQSVFPGTKMSPVTLSRDEQLKLKAFLETLR